MTRHSAELLEASDATIDDAVEYADPMALRGLLYLLTEDEELRGTELTTLVVGGFREARMVASEDEAARIKAKATAFLKSYRDSGAAELPAVLAGRLPDSMSLAVGEDIPPEELENWLEELAIDPWARGLDWSDAGPAPAAAAGFQVVVIGAGMGGINAAVQLKRSGIPFTVLEKNPSVGGTWWENRYPGVRVDTPSRTYSHLYGVNFEKPYPFCPAPENEKYLNWVADTFAVRGDIQFHTEVRSIVWDEADAQWVITADQPEGRVTLRANAVITSVGFLSRPNIPHIDGIEDFQGPWFHTARWPAGLDLAGKRVAVIGTGCTGYQMIPEIAKEVAHLYVFQRTPNWVYDAPGYLAPYPDQATWLDRNFPYLVNFSRLRIAYMFRPQNTLPGIMVDPDFRDEHAVSPVNKKIRDERIAFLTRKLGHRPDLLEKMIPKAPPMSARPVLIDQDYSVIDVLLQDNVTLVSEGIGRVTEDAIELADGTRCPVDVIVLATGFKANDFLWPMEVRGAGGQRLEDLWSRDGARAYIGAMLPGFPNFFMIYGPNTNLLQGMQIIGMEEITARFALENIAGLVESGHRSVEVTEDAYWRYNNELDRAERLTTYLDSRASNYYQNQYGRSAANGPLDSRLLWNWLRDPACRRPDGASAGIDPTLLERYQVLDPHFGGDLLIR
jgi:4-hydroxyacetophenone monooxygenase